MKIKWTKLWNAIDNGDRIPRKVKKYYFGKKLSKTKLKAKLSAVVLGEPSRTMYNRVECNVDLFCPRCGCDSERGTGNIVAYPEHYEKFYCIRCNFLTAIIDNSPYYHALEYKEWNYVID